MVSSPLWSPLHYSSAVPVFCCCCVGRAIGTRSNVSGARLAVGGPFAVMARGRGESLSWLQDTGQILRRILFYRMNTSMHDPLTSDGGRREEELTQPPPQKKPGGARHHDAGQARPSPAKPSQPRTSHASRSVRACPVPIVCLCSPFDDLATIERLPSNPSSSTFRSTQALEWGGGLFVSAASRGWVQKGRRG